MRDYVRRIFSKLMIRRPEMHFRKINSVVLCWMNYSGRRKGKKDEEGRDQGKEMNRKRLILKR